MCGRWIVVVRQVVRPILAVQEIFKIQQLQFYSTFRLLEWIYNISMANIWSKCYCKAFSQQESHSFPCYCLLLSSSQVLSYLMINDALYCTLLLQECRNHYLRIFQKNSAHWPNLNYLPFPLYPGLPPYNVNFASSLVPAPQGRCTAIILSCTHCTNKLIHALLYRLLCKEGHIKIPIIIRFRISIEEY